MNDKMDTGFLVSLDRLDPIFRRRISGLRTTNRQACCGCDRKIGTTDEIAMAVVMEYPPATVGLICRACRALPHAGLGLIEPPETDQMFVAHAKVVECTIALACGLDPDEAVDWQVDERWNYGLEGRTRH